jgi:hypothetical protein
MRPTVAIMVRFMRTGLYATRASHGPSGCVAPAKQVALTADQETRVRPILCDDFEQKRRLLDVVTAPTGGPAARTSPTPAFLKIEAETMVKLKAVLTPEQMKTYSDHREALRQKASQ